MHWKTKKLVWFSLWQYAPYCSGLKWNLLYIWGMPFLIMFVQKRTASNSLDLFSENQSFRFSFVHSLFFFFLPFLPLFLENGSFDRICLDGMDAGANWSFLPWFYPKFSQTLKSPCLCPCHSLSLVYVSVLSFFLENPTWTSKYRLSNQHWVTFLGTHLGILIALFEYLCGYALVIFRHSPWHSHCPLWISLWLHVGNFYSTSVSPCLVCVLLKGGQFVFHLVTPSTEQDLEQGESQLAVVVSIINHLSNTSIFQ